MSRPTKAFIDTEALRHNYRLACRLAPQSNALAVVKADAYGHGAGLAARTLEDLAPAFAVACIEEALSLRQAGIGKPVLLLEGIFSADELELCSSENFWVMAASAEQVDMIVSAQLAQPIQVWLKVDTGMTRLGVFSDSLRPCYDRLKASPNTAGDIVIATHFSSADMLSEGATERQIERFNAVAAQFDAPRSLANSAGLMHWSGARGQWNRPGLMLYGASPFPGSHPVGDQLRPVMSLQSAVIRVADVQPGVSVGYAGNWTAARPSRIATIAIGYGDGYPRGAGNGTPVLVNGQRAPLAGRVSMDMITVDVTELEGVAVGSPVELWGENITAAEVADCAGTINYELLTRMPGRVPRIAEGHF